MSEVVDDRATFRAGVASGVVAYGLWGIFPLFFRLLRSVPAAEILLHRVVWSFAFVVAVLAVQARRPGRGRRPSGWFGELWGDQRRLRRLAAAGALVAVNWFTYIWAVNRDRVVEAALGYYINPLITVALGVLVLGERLHRLQVASLGLGAAAVAVLTVAYGRLPWVALVLATTFAGYGYLKKSVGVGAVASLAVETAVLLPVAVGGLALLALGGELAFLHGAVSRDVLLVGLGLVTAVPLLAFGASASRIPLSLLGLLQYITPTLQLLCGVVILGEPLPPARLAGFVLVWAALAALTVDAVRSTRAAGRRRAAQEPALGPATGLGADGVV